MLKMLLLMKPIKPEWFREYISVGFEAFFNNPDILKEHDLKLYNFLKEIIK